MTLPSVESLIEKLTQAGIDVTLICDNVAGVLIKQGKIDAVITGCPAILWTLMKTAIL